MTRLALRLIHTTTAPPPSRPIVQACAECGGLWCTLCLGHGCRHVLRALGFKED